MDGQQKTAYCLNTGYVGCSVLTIIRKIREISAFQKPGSWADMDMLEIGNGNMTLHEQQTHQSFWAALKPHLIIGADLRTLPEESLETLKNLEMVEISQNGLEKAVNYLESLSQERETQVWAGPLSGDRTVVLVFNERNHTTAIKLPVTSLPGLSGDEFYRARDVWENMDLPKVRGNLTVDVETHQTRVLIIGQ